MNSATDTAPASPMPSHTTEDMAPDSRQRINPWRRFIGAMIPNWLLCRREISQGAKLAYARFAQYAGEGGHCFPKQDTMASELGVSGRAVRDYIRELEKFALLESEQPGLRQSNRYYFLDHAWMQENGSPISTSHFTGWGLDGVSDGG